MSGRKVKVEIAEGRVVYVDGTAYLAGQTVEVSDADAKKLLGSGDARKAG